MPDLPSSRHEGTLDPALLIGLLKSALDALALPGPDQLEYVHRLGAGVDELALQFDDVAGTRELLLEAGEMSAEQSAAIGAVDGQLEAMTAAGPTRWTEQAVDEGEDWSEVRRLARAALRLLED